MSLAYCDAFASFIRKSLVSIKPEDQHFDTINGLVGGVIMDLHPTEGYFQSTRKTIDCTDSNGKAYRITVEEL